MPYNPLHYRKTFAALGRPTDAPATTTTEPSSAISLLKGILTGVQSGGGGGNIASINGQTGPAITIAAGAGISVTNPSANTIQINNTGGGGGGIPEAPSDSTLYGRKNGAWAQAQPLDGDLTALAGLTGLNVIYYRSGSDTWSAVTVGTGLAFVGGTLTATGGGGGGIPEAPTDSKYYARRNSAWADISVTFAPLASPTFSGTPSAPTAAAADNSTQLATTAFVKTTVAGYQPLDGDLTALAGFSGSNIIPYRSGSNTWGTVTIGTGLTFTAGTLAVTGGTGSVNTSGAVTAAQLAGYADTTGNLIQGINLPAAGLTRAGVNLQLANDLAALEALTGVSTIYYRSGTDAWSPVTVGLGLSFVGGTLSAPGGGTAVPLSIVTRTFTASGTYTPTAGMTNCVIECIAGGGAGGGVAGDATIMLGGGGGGAGGYSRKSATATQIGVAQTINVGIAGTGGIGTGNAGGNTNVGSLCIALGGGGGLGASSAAIGGGGGGGGSGTGDVTATGARGGNGDYWANPPAGGSTPAGWGASSPFGMGGAPGQGASTGGASNGGVASGYGAGGGGGSANLSADNGNGGSGSPGLIIITEYIGGGGGDVSRTGIPTNGQLAQWTDGTHIQGIDISASGFAPLASPAFTGTPTAPTASPGTNTTQIATTAFVAAGFQPLDADLTSLAAASGTNAIYYRSAANTWAAVTVGTGLTFSSGTLAASGSGAPVGAEYITSTADATLTAERVLTDTATVTWDRTTAGQIKANAAGGAGGVLTAKITTFTSSGTFTPSANMKFCIIECGGGGAAGGGVTAATGFNINGGGGGAGGYSRKYATPTDIGASKSVTVGAAGAGVLAGAGGAGGASSVGTLCIANGGSGGGAASTGLNGLGGAGGVTGGAVGDLVVPGGAGTGGFFVSYGASGLFIIIAAGDGGASFFGGGGTGAVAGATSVANGSNGTSYGGGGGGGGVNNSAASNTIGGNGAPGVVIITEFIG